MTDIIQCCWPLATDVTDGIVEFVVVSGGGEYVAAADDGDGPERDDVLAVFSSLS